MNDYSTSILADLTNVASHLWIFQNKKHSFSCLLCGSHCKDIYTCQNTLFRIPTASDLVLLKSETKLKVRRLIMNVTTTLEQDFQHELVQYLHYVKNTDQIQQENEIVVVVIKPQDSLKSYHNYHAVKHVVMIVDESYINNLSVNLKNNTTNIIYLVYFNYEKMLEYLIHISMITKQRLRLKDLETYLPKTCGYVYKHEDLNRCLFI